MMNTYDENLLENKFFIQLQAKYNELYARAADNRWTLCIPKSATTNHLSFSQEDFENHILIATEDGSSKFRTVNDKEVIVQSSVITTGDQFAEVRSVPILFEETFYNDNDESYRVLCINIPLEGDKTDEVDGYMGVNLQSLEDCMQLLWGRTSNSKSRRQVDSVIDLFNNTYSRLEGESLRHHVDAANALFTRTMQTVLKEANLKKNARHNKAFMDSVKTAVETYLMHGIYRKLFKGISACLASKDSSLNKLNRNLSELQLRDLGVRVAFSQNVPRARRDLSQLNRYSTPLGKLNCIKRAVLTIMQPPKFTNSDGSCSAPLTTDDLLPILVFLVVKTDIPNWWANQAYMTNFRFSKTNNDDEYGFYLASMEAAIEHVSSGELSKVELGVDSPQRVVLSVSPGAGSIWHRQDSSENSKIQALFQFVKENRLEESEKLLTQHKLDLEDAKLKMCHPLCSCDACSRIVTDSQTDTDAVTVFTRDDRGCTVLHIAAMYGHAELTDMLIRKGAVVNATDYHGYSPLHIACQKGHQSVTLLLLHYKAQVNLPDNDGNTALHLAVAHGHEDCVKALVYYDQGATSLDMNRGNDYGDTALHLAAKWGYDVIVEILIENGASLEARNRKKQTPVNCAHNAMMVKLLQTAAEEKRELEKFVHLPLPARPRSVTVLSARETPPPGSLPLAPDEPHSTEPVSTPQKKIEKLLKAAADGDEQMMRYHLGWVDDSDDDIDDVDFSKRELCHPLCQCSRCQPLQKFTTSSSGGVHVNSVNCDGFTALHVAARHGHADLVELLLKRGANANAKTSNNESSSLHLACLNNKLEVAHLLLEHGAKVNQRDHHGNAGLHYCCHNGNLKIAKELLKHGANANLANHKGNTALHEAARWIFADMVHLLLLYGASVNSHNKQQLTPVHLAESDEIARILLERSRMVSENGECDHLDDLPPSRPKAKKGTVTKRLSIRELFAAFEDKDLKHLEKLAESIQTFPKQQKLRRAITRDRSAPRLDALLKHQLEIQNFNPQRLRRTSTDDRSSPVVPQKNVHDDRSNGEDEDCLDIRSPPWSEKEMCDMSSWNSVEANGETGDRDKEKVAQEPVVRFRKNSGFDEECTSISMSAGGDPEDENEEETVAVDEALDKKVEGSCVDTVASASGQTALPSGEVREEETCEIESENSATESQEDSAPDETLCPTNSV